MQAKCRTEYGARLPCPLIAHLPNTDKPIRSIAADAAGDEHNALYDKTLSRSSGAGLLFNQTIRRMSHAVMRGSSDSVIMVLRRL